MTHEEKLNELLRVLFNSYYQEVKRLKTIVDSMIEEGYNSDEDRREFLNEAIEEYEEYRDDSKDAKRMQEFIKKFWETHQ